MFFSPKIVRLLGTVGFTLGFYFWDPPWLTNLARKINLWPSFFKDSTIKGLLCVALGVLLAWGLSLIPWWSLLVLVGLMCLGAWASDREARRLGQTDPSVIVIDEIVGMAVALWGLPLNWGTIIAGFIIFRALDIRKPGPIRWMDQKIRGGGGIMADDLAAGIVVNLVLRAALKIFNG